jgi:hypothetical protein
VRIAKPVAIGDFDDLAPDIGAMAVSA